MLPVLDALTRVFKAYGDQQGLLKARVEIEGEDFVKDSAPSFL